MDPGGRAGGEMTGLDCMLLVRTLPLPATRSIWQVCLSRVSAVLDLPGEEIGCVADRFCHNSQVSAIQRWGLFVHIRID